MFLLDSSETLAPRWWPSLFMVFRDIRSRCQSGKTGDPALNQFNRPLMNELQINCLEQRAVTQEWEWDFQNNWNGWELIGKVSAVCLRQRRNHWVHTAVLSSLGAQGPGEQSKSATCHEVRSTGYSRRKDWEPDFEISAKSGNTANLTPSQAKSGKKTWPTCTEEPCSSDPRCQTEEMSRVSLRWHGSNGEKSDFWKIRWWKEGERGH